MRKREKMREKRERKEIEKEINRERKKRKREKRMSRVNYYQSALNSQISIPWCSVVIYDVP